eukprot:865217_1
MDTAATCKPFDDHPFIWLNKWIIYCPMWTSTTVHNNKIIPRNPWVAKILYYSLLLICVAFWVYDIFWFVYQLGFNLFTLIATISITLTSISRLVCFYYFFDYFKFYGAGMHEEPNKYEIIDLTKKSTTLKRVSSLSHVQHHSLAKKTGIRFQVILCWVMVASILIQIILIINVTKENDEAFKSESPISARLAITLWHLIFGFIYIYFYQIPLFLAQFVLSIYYVRACIFIKEFTQMIDKSIVDFDAAIEKYSAYRREFVHTIKLLEVLIMFRLGAQISWVWIDLTMILDAQSWSQIFIAMLWLTKSTLPFVEIVMAGNAATNKFRVLHRKLYQFGTEKKNLGEISPYDHSRYLFLLDYVTMYPLVIKMLGQEISYRNAAKVTAAFVAAKTISYLFKANVISI